VSSCTLEKVGNVKNIIVTKTTSKFRLPTYNFLVKSQFTKLIVISLFLSYILKEPPLSFSFCFFAEG